jgi:hypothetical protein
VDEPKAPLSIKLETLDLSFGLYWRLDQHMGAWGIEPPGPPYPPGAAAVARITIGNLMKR